MYVNVTLQQTEKLLRGNQAFSQLGFSMMLTRLKTQYVKEPSQSMLQKCADEINTFLDKFKSIMGNDYATIAKI